MKCHVTWYFLLCLCREEAGAAEEEVQRAPAQKDHALPLIGGQLTLLQGLIHTHYVFQALWKKL